VTSESDIPDSLCVLPRDAGNHPPTPASPTRTTGVFNPNDPRVQPARPACSTRVTRESNPHNPRVQPNDPRVQPGRAASSTRTTLVFNRSDSPVSPFATHRVSRRRLANRRSPPSPLRNRRSPRSPVRNRRSPWLSLPDPGLARTVARVSGTRDSRGDHRPCWSPRLNSRVMRVGLAGRAGWTRGMRDAGCGVWARRAVLGVSLRGGGVLPGRTAGPARDRAAAPAAWRVAPPAVPSRAAVGRRSASTSRSPEPCAPSLT
jgi:hypothetical protein